MIRNYWLLLCLLILAACGDSGSSTASNTMTFSSIPSSGIYTNSAAKTSMLLVGDVNCPAGGIQVETGIDLNGNSLLDTVEVTKTQKVCNGAAGEAGASGLNALVTLGNEEAGASCASGGVRIDSGQDVNLNGVLDNSEKMATTYICNGSSSLSSQVNIALADVLPGTWNYVGYDNTTTSSATAKSTGVLILFADGTYKFTPVVAVNNVESGGSWSVENGNVLALTKVYPYSVQNSTRYHYVDFISGNQIEMDSITDGFVILTKQP